MKQNNVKQHLKSRTREEIISILTATEDTSKIWHVLSKQSKEHIISIYSLQNVLKLTYDRVFRSIFDPEIHPLRLARFLSQILGREITILQALPVEKNNYHIRANVYIWTF